jgi:hypothetical protein
MFPLEHRVPAQFQQENSEVRRERPDVFKRINREVPNAKLRRDFESGMRKYGGEDEEEDSGIGR